MIKKILRKLIRETKFFGNLYEFYCNYKFNKFIAKKNKNFTKSGIKTFEQLCILLNEKNIKFWLCYGTLLGFIQERILAYNIGIAVHDMYFAAKILEKIQQNSDKQMLKFWV